MYKFFSPGIILTIAVLAGCSEVHLSGTLEPSEDGKTYLAIDDNNGGHCESILVDGEVWSHPVKEPAQIEPGVHYIQCGSKVEVDIPEATLFHFNHWDQ